MSKQSLRDETERLIKEADSMPIQYVGSTLPIAVDRHELLTDSATERVEFRKVISADERQAMFFQNAG